MTVPASAEFDPATTLDLWEILPLASDPDTASAWAVECAARWQAATGATPDARDQVERFLRAIWQGPRHEGFGWRAAFVLGPEYGAAVFDIALIQPSRDLNAVVESALTTNLGSQVDDFSMNDLQGKQSVHFLLDGDAGDASRSITALISSAVTRDVPPFGSCVLLARSHTRRLEAAMAALIPLQYLLTSEDLLDLVSGTA